MPAKDDNLAERIFGEAVNDSEDQEERAPKSEQPGEETETEGREPEEPKLLAGKFKSVEELEKAYLEGEKWWTRTSQEAAALRKELEQLKNQLMPDMTKKQQEEWKKHVQAAINAAVVDENPEPLMNLIAFLVDYRAEAKFQERYGQLAPVVKQHEFQQEINTWLAENPEAAAYIEDMAKIIEAEPELVMQPNWLDKAFARVLKQKLGLAEKAKVDAKALAEAEKQAAAVPASGARGKEQKKSPEEELLERIFGLAEKPKGVLG